MVDALMEPSVYYRFSVCCLDNNRFRRQRIRVRVGCLKRKEQNREVYNTVELCNIFFI